MSITSAFVLFAVIWFLTFLIALPIRVKTQGDMGEIEPGTHAGAPQEHHLKKKAWITTGVALVLSVAISGIILSGKFPISELDLLPVIAPLE